VFQNDPMISDQNEHGESIKVTIIKPAIVVPSIIGIVEAKVQKAIV